MKSLSPNERRVFDYLRRIAPECATNADIVRATGIQPHQQVFQITKRLMAKGLVEGIQSRYRHREWTFRIRDAQENDLPSGCGSRAEEYALEESAANSLSPAAFEALARRVMSEYYDLPLSAGSIPGIPKRFDMVSPDGSTVGDAKYYTLVRGELLPPAKFSVIAEHVWLLEKTPARNRFLVFGNERRVPEQWLARYGHLVCSVNFFYQTNSELLEKLND